MANAIMKNELLINQINNLFKFVQEDTYINLDFHTYITPIKNNITSNEQFRTIIANYAFDRKLENKNISQWYIEKHTKIDKQAKNVYESFSNSISSVFKIEKISKNKFELYNLINEKKYSVNILTTMNKFKGVEPCNYLIGRIFSYEEEYYLIEINNVLSSMAKENAYQMAVMKQLENPALIYEDNENKLKEIKKNLSLLNKKFESYFKSDEFITTTKHVDGFLNDFNEYIEGNKRCPRSLEIPSTNNYSFFDVKELTTNIKKLDDAIISGFSSHEKTYDIGVIFDKKLGLTVLPFYGTFKQIFEVEDYKTISGYKSCIEDYFNNLKIPPNAILRVYNNNPERCQNIISEIFQTDKTVEDLLKAKKSKFYDNVQFTAPTILYSSKTFSELVNIAEHNMNKIDLKGQKVGRNDLCPCGSGKKYKKCCLEFE